MRTPRRRPRGERARHDSADPTIRPDPFDSVDALLAVARSQYERVTARAAHDRVRAGAVIVDIRPAWQRDAEGEIPGSVVIERNHLEWRLYPDSGAALAMAHETREWIVICREGYSSSLAAASLCSLGLSATDVIDGFLAWRAAGLPVVAGCTAVEQVVGVTTSSPRTALPPTGDQATLS